MDALFCASCPRPEESTQVGNWKLILEPIWGVDLCTISLLNRAQLHEMFTLHRGHPLKTRVQARQNSEQQDILRGVRRTRTKSTVKLTKV